MVFQKVLKGINGIDETTAKEMLMNGIICSWWRTVGTITPEEIKLHLTTVNADLHLNHYHKPVPATNPLSALGSSKFGEVSPFISTTAGTVYRDEILKKNIIFAPFMTALRFATNNFKSKGYIFYAYLVTIGKVAVEMEQFSEEVRELNIYREYLPYQKQGEIMAKIIIPSVQIEKVEGYDGPEVMRQFNRKKKPTAFSTLNNSTYQPPELFSNIREVLS